jgi:hypothetical protein
MRRGRSRRARCPGRTRTAPALPGRARRPALPRRARRASPHASGEARCRCCSSARMKPMCSLCTPVLPVLRKGVAAGMGRPASSRISPSRRATLPCRSPQRGPRPLAARLHRRRRTRTARRGSARGRPAPSPRACAIPRCPPPAAPPSRPRAAGGSALPSPPCRRWRRARCRWTSASFSHSSLKKVAMMVLRTTVTAKSPRGSSTSVTLR